MNEQTTKEQVEVVLQDKPTHEEFWNNQISYLIKQVKSAHDFHELKAVTSEALYALQKLIQGEQDDKT